MVQVTVTLKKLTKQLITVEVDAPNEDTAKEMVFEDGFEAFKVVDEEPEELLEERQEVY